VEITVAEILQSDFLKDAKVIAGKRGLFKPVSSVTVGEVPDIADWLKGG
jgi:PucR family transcriptional regulator, purine catabolism regulatory protein